jgi:hypothetical protein
MQAKLGGIPWAVQTNDLDKFNKVPTMVIGYDIHHKKRQKSTLAFNATMDRNFCRYWSRSFEEEEGQEFGTKLESTLLAAMEAFAKSNNGTFPQ